MVMRLLRHLFAPRAGALFPDAGMARIAGAIADGERRHTGEVCFAVEAALPLPALWRGVDARGAAEQAFARLRVWDTAANNGVLLYLLLADHRIEIVADRGLEAVSPAQWRGVCELVEARLRAGDPEAAIVRGVAAISDLLAVHFPQADGVEGRDELPNRPTIL